jgi:hypothetical protein
MKQKRLTQKEKVLLNELSNKFNRDEESLTIEEMKNLCNLFSRDNELKQVVIMKINNEIKDNKITMEKLEKIIPIAIKGIFLIKSKMNECQQTGKY